MSTSNSIVLAGAPHGKFLEGIVSGTPKPGTAMMLSEGVEPVGGRHQWEAFDATDGDRTLCAILLEDYFLGKDHLTALVTGSRIRMYCPIPGDEMQVLLQNVGGTADAYTIGQKLIMDNASGLFIGTTGSPEREPFLVMETLAGLTADTLCTVIYTGV